MRWKSFCCLLWMSTLWQTSRLSTAAAWAIRGRFKSQIGRTLRTNLSHRQFGLRAAITEPRLHHWFQQPRSLSVSTSSVDISSEITSEETRIYQELKSISEEIRRHDDLYYAGKTEISDDDYDALTRREEEICRTMPLLRAKLQQESGIGEQATRLGRVGAKISGRKKRKHLVPMLSLENVTTEGQVLAWLERIRKKLVDAKIAKVTIITEPKLDGVSLSLRYERQHADGIFSFQWASTRGDGKQGQDVTEAVVNGMNIPKTFRCDQATNLPSEIEIRGEVVLPNTAFRLLLESNQTLNTTSFANARNAASGILLRKSSSASKEDDAESNLLRSKLCFNAYDIIGMTQLNEGDQLEMRTKLEAAGFSVPYPFEVTHLTVDNATKWATSDIQPMLNYHCALERHRNRESDNDVISTDKLLEWGDYDMDGAVHKVSDPVLRQLLGTSNRAPRWAVAHKFPATSALTTLHDVLVQVGRTGSLTPVAVLEPVELGGAKIQRATLHNFFYMKQVLGGRGRIPSGCKVLVRRAGDVIPQVVHLVGNESLDDSLASSWISLEPPTTCPACGSPTVLAAPTRNSNSSSSDVGEGETETGQVWRCSGQPLLCPPRAVLALKHAYSRDALDITGLSEARIEQLMEAGFLRFPSDLFRLNATQWEEIANMTGWGVKSATNLKANADRVVQDGVSLSRFIYSLGIRFAGIHSSKLLATAYGSAEAFLSEMTTAAENNGEYGVESVALPTLAGESEATKGVGPVLKNSLVAFAQESELLGAATELHQAILVLDDEDYNVSEQTGIAMPTDSQPLYGMTVVFTGSIEEMSRTEGQKLAKLMGAKSTPNTVTKATSLVVVGDNGGTKKLEKAQDLEVKFMPAKEFLDLANKTIKKP